MKTMKFMVIFLIVAIILSTGCSKKSNTPDAEEWSFDTEKVREIQQIGDDTLLRPGELRAADDGTLYIHDFERQLSYIIDANGKIVSKFAT